MQDTVIPEFTPKTQTPQISAEGYTVGGKVLVHEGKGGNTRKAMLKGIYKDKTAHIKYIHGEDVRAYIYGRCSSIYAIYLRFWCASVNEDCTANPDPQERFNAKIAP